MDQPAPKMPERDPAPAPEPYTTPRWVKVFGMIVLVIIALVVVLMLIRGPGGHGPSRHMSEAPGPTQQEAAGALAAATHASTP